MRICISGERSPELRGRAMNQAPEMAVPTPLVSVNPNPVPDMDCPNEVFTRSIKRCGNPAPPKPIAARDGACVAMSAIDSSKSCMTMAGAPLNCVIRSCRMISQAF
jgi:hypothetical protein